MKRVIDEQVLVRWFTAVALAFAGSLQLLGTSTSAQSGSGPTFKTQTDYVEVDAVVTDAQGNAVRGLTKADFQVLEDGTPQVISTFTEVTVPMEARPSTTAGVTDADVRSNARPFAGRLYVLVLDDLHVDVARSQRVKQSVRLFIEQYVAANDLTAIVFTGRSVDIQPFTSNRALLLAAVDRFVGRKLQSATLARNERYRNERTIADAAAAQGAAAMPRVEDPFDDERAKNASSMLATLRSVADWFGRVQGRRKSLLLFSEGIDYDLDDIIRPQTYNGSPSAALPIVNDIRDTIARTARANVSIYAVDPRGLATAGEETISVSSFADQSDPAAGIGPGTLGNEVRLSQDSLRWLADDSGGFASVNRNDTSQTFERIVRDNSAHYLFAYYPPPTTPDGKFHRIDVKVNRPGLTVRARSGYTATKPATGARNTGGLAPELFDVLNSPVPVSGVTMRLFAAPFKAGRTAASVLVGVELDADGLSLDKGNKIDVAVAAFRADGKVFGPENDTLTLNLRPETRSTVEQRGLRFLHRLELPAGRYQLRAAAHDRQRNVVGSVVYDFDVPDLAKESISISGLVLTSRESASSMTARADQRLSSQLATPPTGIRAFEQEDELVLYSEIYDNSVVPLHAVEITTSVSNDAGETLIVNEDSRETSAASATTAQFPFAKPIPLVALAPGEYALRLGVRSRITNAGADRTVRFRVIPSGERRFPSPTVATPRTTRSPTLSIDSEYLTLITQYMRGQTQGAIASLAKVPSERIRAQSEVDFSASGLEIGQIEAAAMLHSDVAMFVATADQRLSRQHVDAARALVGTLPDDGPGGFRQRWQAYAVAPYLIQHDLYGAMRAAREGVGRLPRSADFALLQGTLLEISARIETADFRGIWSPTDGINRNASPTVAHMEDALVAAAITFQRALELDPSLMSARLRLGWVYGINHSSERARKELRTVADSTSSRELRYLAHLFLGGLAEGEGDLERAYDEYESAHTAMPDAQSAHIALMHVARVTGRTALVQELAAQYPRRSTSMEDPWWYFSMGFDSELVNWLHARVTAR